MAKVQNTISTGVATLLAEHGIDQILIVDDAYDEISISEFQANEIGDFWNRLAGDFEAIEELRSFGLTAQSQSDITDQFLQELWDRRREVNALLQHFDALFENRISKLEQLEPLIANLEALEIATVESNANISKIAGIGDGALKIVFIDYFLGHDSNDDAVRTAVAVAKRIYELCPHGKKPVFVLMSTQPSVIEHAEEFRVKSGLLEGLFYCLPKADLRNKQILALRLGTWMKALPVGHAIQEFIDALTDAAEQTADRFKSEIRQLRLEDYAYIFQLSLRDDGQPLGDYMSWLYGTYFGHLLFDSEQVRAQRDNLDKLKFQDLLPSPLTPTPKLAEIYKHALFDFHVNQNVAYPGTIGAQANPDGLAYVQLGDVFHRMNDSTVWMVITADCDLSLTDDGKRSIHPGQTILGVPGKLQKLAVLPAGDDRTRTELFEINGQAFRIQWDITKVKSFPYGGLNEVLRKHGYNRVARLRLPYALGIQQAFASSLTRIGMPVAPPIYNPVGIQVLCKDPSSDKCQILIHDDRDSAFIIMVRDGSTTVAKCFLTEQFVSRIPQMLVQLKEKLLTTTAPGELPGDENGYGNLSRKAKKIVLAIDAHKDNPESLIHLIDPIKLPQPGKLFMIDNNTFAVGRNLDANRKYPEQSPLLLINLLQ